MRAALERALDEARQGEEPPPKELVPYLSFQKLNPTALTAILRVLDTDEEFRLRVLAATPPDSINAAGWLALSRPPGWEDLVRSLAEGRVEATGTQEAERRLRDLQRAREAADRKREQAEAELARYREAVEAHEEQLSVLRRERRQSEEALRAAERRAEALEQKLVDRDARVAEAQGAREAREHELTETGRQLAEARAEIERRPAPLVPGERPVDVAALRAAADRLRRSAATLAKSVEGTLDAIPPEPVVLGEERGPQARAALTLPGGVVADSVEGARWLLGRPSVVLLVDGYNVAKTAWPDAALEEQRQRLLRALDELAMRTGATAELVYDGPDDATPTTRQGSRSVSVRYSDGALADDVVVDLIGTFPAGRPVVVVSNDREVRDGARQEGANVIGSRTLISLFSG